MIKVASVADFVPGQAITSGGPGSQEQAVVASVGSSGATVVRVGNEQGGTVLQVADVRGFTAGQAITIGEGADADNAMVAAAEGGRAGARITVRAPLGGAHAAGTRVAGSGITLTRPLHRGHADGAPVTAELSTPGSANVYTRSRALR